MILVLSGPPASGKTVFSSIVGANYRLPVINAGGLLREITPSSIWYAPIHEHMDSGKLVPESISGGFLAETVKDPMYKDGYVLDGWLRQLADMDYFDPKPDYVIYLNISRDTAIARLSGRLLCPNCGKSYNSLFLPPKEEGICDNDKSPLIKRTDDSPATIKKRFEVFVRDTLPVLDYFRRAKKLVEIDASKKPEEMLIELVKKVKK